MYVRLEDEAPNFTADTSEGTINFYDWLGDSWCILFSHPKDFTPVCTTELGAVAKLKHEFDKRGVKVLALSVDTVTDHQKWIDDINETQNTTVNYPIIADSSGHVANLYGMIHPNAEETQTVRNVFIIAPDKKVKLMTAYPAATGRNFDEILRTIDSLQLTYEHSVGTPANWEDGEDCLIMLDVPDEEIPERFPKGCTKVRSYMRYTPQPNK